MFDFIPEQLLQNVQGTNFPSSSIKDSPQYLIAKLLEDMLLDSQKTLDIQRQATFTKRAATIALHSTDSGLSLGMLYVIYRMMKRYPKLRSMLEDDEGAGPVSTYYSKILSSFSADGKTQKGKKSHKASAQVSKASEDDGEYEEEDPSQHSGALYAPLWELSILAAHHSNPAVQKAAHMVSMMSIAAAQAAAIDSSIMENESIGNIISTGNIQTIFNVASGAAKPSTIVAQNTTQLGGFHPTPAQGPPFLSKRSTKKTATTGQADDEMAKIFLDNIKSRLL